LFLALAKKGGTFGVTGRVLRRGENFGLAFGGETLFDGLPAGGICRAFDPGGATGVDFGRFSLCLVVDER